jgi:Fe-S cluster biogenesis protein NfuA
MARQNEIERQIESIEVKVRALENSADPAERANAKELVQALMALHGEGIARMMEIINESGDPGKAVIYRFETDQLVRSLLLLYGLHPVDLETRVRQALEKTRSYLRSQRGGFEFVGVDETGLVTLRQEGRGDGCGSSYANLRKTVEEAIYEAAPDISGIFVQNAPPDSGAVNGFVPLSNLQGKNLSLTIPEGRSQVDAEQMRIQGSAI